MVQRGIVSEIEGDQVILAALSEKDDEGSCETGGCGSGCSCNVTGQLFTAKNSKGLPLQKGDKVEVEAAKSSVVYGAFLVFGLPIILGALFWWAIPQVLRIPQAGWMGLLGALAGVGLSLLLGKLQKEEPEVSAILN